MKRNRDKIQYFETENDGTLYKIIVCAVVFHLAVVGTLIALHNIDLSKPAEEIPVFEMVQVDEPMKQPVAKAAPPEPEPQQAPKVEPPPPAPPEPVPEVTPEPEPVPAQSAFVRYRAFPRHRSAWHDARRFPRQRIRVQRVFRPSGQMAGQSRRSVVRNHRPDMRCPDHRHPVILFACFRRTRAEADRTPVY